MLFLRNFPIDFADIGSVQTKILVLIDHTVHLYGFCEHTSPVSLSAHHLTGWNEHGNKALLFYHAARLDMALSVHSIGDGYQDLPNYHSASQIAADRHAISPGR